MELVRVQDQERGGESESEGYFVPAAAAGLPPRFEERPGSPAWRRALELGAQQRRN